MAVSIVLDGADVTDHLAGVAFVTASFSPTANHRYVLGIVYAHASATPVVPSSVTHAGSGLTITYREDQAYKTAGSNRTALAIYTLDAGPSVSAGTISLTWVAAMIGAGWTIIDLDTYTYVPSNKTESGGATSSGANRTATLGTPVDATNSRPMYYFSANSAANWTAEGTWATLQNNAQINPSMTRMAAWHSSAWDASIAITNGNVAAIDNGVIAWELAALVTGAATGDGTATATAATNLTGTASGAGAATGTGNASLTGAATGTGTAAASAATALTGTASGAGTATGTGAANLTGAATGDGVATADVEAPPGDAEGFATGDGGATATVVTVLTGTATGNGVAVALVGDPRDITVTVGAADDAWSTGRPAGTRTVTRTDGAYATSRPAGTRTATRPADRWTATRGT